MKTLEHNPYYPISDDILDSLQCYLDHKIPCGGFLTAVLEGRLYEAFARADVMNSANMRNIVGYIWNEMPASSYGSPERVAEHYKKEVATC